VHAFLRQALGLDLDQAAEAATVVGAVAAGDQLDGAHQLAVDRRPEAPHVVERRDLDAVDVDLGLARGRAPHHQSARAEGAARHAREVLHHLERVALVPGTRRASSVRMVVSTDSFLMRGARVTRSSSMPSCFSSTKYLTVFF